MKRRIYQIIITTGTIAVILLLAAGFFSGKLVPKSATTSAAPIVPPGSNDTLIANTSYGYMERRFTNPQGDSLTYYLYVPEHYVAQKKYPLVLLLHGGGEKSKDSNSPAQNREVILRQRYVEVWGSGYTGENNPEIQQHWPGFIIVPQISTKQQWVKADPHKGSYQQSDQPTTQLLLTMQLLDSLQHKYTGIDQSRRYITGISSGAYAVWDATERWPGYFAAAAPLSGAGDPSKASAIKNLPIWAFHSANDGTIPVSGSREMIAALKAAGGKPHYTEFPKLGHEVWYSVFSLRASPVKVTGFFSWLFAQHK